MQRKINVLEFGRVYRAYSNRFIAEHLNLKIETVKKRAYRYGLRKNPAHLSRVRSEAGYLGTIKRWGYEKAV